VARAWTDDERARQRLLLPSARAKAIRAKGTKRFTASALGDVLARMKAKP
jgi:hypothetical protein